MSQWLGGAVCVFSHSPFQVSSVVKWPFKDLDFVLMRTGESFPTWRHLPGLDPFLKSEGFKNLKKLSHRAGRAVAQGRGDLFLSTVREYGEGLRQARLVHPETQKLLKSISRIPCVLAAKGTGAMGAETLVVFFRSCEKKRLLQDLNLPCGQKKFFTRKDLFKKEKTFLTCPNRQV